MIALYQGKSLLSRLIRWRTWSKFSHAAWIKTDGSVIEAWSPGGVRLVDNLSTRHTPGTTVLVYDVPGVNREVVEAFLVKQIGKPYDYWNILGFVFRGKIHDPHKWICSELVFAALLAGGVRVLNAPAWKVSPGDLSLSPVLTFVRREIT